MANSIIKFDDERLMDLVETHEGRKLVAYLCPTGKISIGVGRNIEDLGISSSECDYLFKNDLERCIAELIGFRWFIELSVTRQAAMVDMNFNLGMTRFKKFTRMMSALSAHDYKQAAMEMLDSKWARQVPDRARRLAFIMLYDTFPRD